MDSLTTINKVLSIVLQEERQQGYGTSGCIDMKDHDAEALVNVVERNGTNRNFGRGRGYCQARRGRGNSFVNNVGTEFQELDAKMKMKGTGEGNMSLTQKQYKWLISLLEKNNTD
ncbi:hypothetical protein KIW84_071512 [Lathyrus oleraceus]|uniref:Uncharacterized protein n=1 Tax=Pisum sativum TaxID=3888 RepID=A0A9D4VJ81_PEA|nr:hypothetical protein KIW84_071512 [Pisum sativum]